jgi:hypothetical protein
LWCAYHSYCNALHLQYESGSSSRHLKDQMTDKGETASDDVVVLRTLHAKGELNVQQVNMKALPKCLTSTLAIQASALY